MTSTRGAHLITGRPLREQRRCCAHSACNRPLILVAGLTRSPRIVHRDRVLRGTLPPSFTCTLAYRRAGSRLRATAQEARALGLLRCVSPCLRDGRLENENRIRTESRIKTDRAHSCRELRSTVTYQFSENLSPGTVGRKPRTEGVPFVDVVHPEHEGVSVITDASPARSRSVPASWHRRMALSSCHAASPQVSQNTRNTCCFG